MNDDQLHEARIKRLRLSSVAYASTRRRSSA